MSRKLTYNDVCLELSKRGCLDEFLATRDDFNKETKRQKCSGLYTKFHFVCRECGRNIYKNLASVKANKRPWLCQSCSARIGSEWHRADYDEAFERVVEMGLTPLFSAKDIRSVKQIVSCIGVCGHEITTTLQSLLKSKTKMCVSCAAHLRDGENNYNWKGGYKNKRAAFRASYESKSFVKAVLKRDGYSCVICGKRRDVEVHHKDGYSWCLDRRADVTNGVTLCFECHKKFHRIFGNKFNTELQYLMFEDMSKAG